MKNNLLWLKRVTKFGVFLMMGVSMSACSGSSWKEEVLLHDGSKIIVKRSVERGGRHEIGQEPPIKEQSLSFILPGTNENVTWEDKFTEDVGGANFLPMLLGVLKDIAYLVVHPMGSLSYMKWGSPNPPYIVFKYQNKKWNRITLQELPVELTTPNLIFSSPDDEAKKSGRRIVSAEAIKRLYDGYRQPEYKTILRTPLEHWKPRPGTNNGKLIRTEDGWASPDMIELKKKVEERLKAQREAGDSKE
jgi:hypothetical protein